ncbi:hypothetical protein H5P28_08545 [Ruficoccus amylovorans]|uniref:Uncharacterized protein n=1 Tax=Ruficoccus amylovorans TaxID=1804625 RepID=A0A842HDM0_9BACT|nr:hypothetical protein [Ruficoccus amylovorans]MBC2594309.1 hypothetical protein [Ruficoccus amylovorans]
MTPWIDFSDTGEPVLPRSGQYQPPSAKVRQEMVSLGRELLLDPEYPASDILRKIANAVIEGR